MDYFTKPSLIGRLAEKCGLNSKFNEVVEDKVEQDGAFVVSPVEAKLVHVGEIEKRGQLISKFGRKIDLIETLGENANLFDDGMYFNFYLSPRDKHYWRIPYSGKIVSVKVNEGEARIPVVVGLESFFTGTDFFEKAIKKNATIGSVFQAKDFYYAMIAVGSLNVNSIHVVKEHYFKKGEFAGNFNLGSSLLLCFSRYSLESLVDVGAKVKIGEALLRVN